MGTELSEKVRTEKVMVSPNLAASWLGTMRRNRTLSANRVKRLAAEMKAGKWMLNGQTIVFDGDGHLVDGQHRLNAVLVSEATVPMMVVRGVSGASWDTLDTGRARSTADALTAKGRVSARMLGAALRLLYQRTLGVLGSTEMEHQPTTHDIVGLDDEFPAVRDAVSWTMAKRHTKNAAVGFLRFVCCSEGPADAAEDFFTGIRDGEKLSAGTGTYAAREYLLGAYGAEERDTQRVVLAKLIKAWNAHLADVPRRRLQWAPEEEAFPTIHLTKAAAIKSERGATKKGI